jgi:hypothetical protein
VIALLSTIQASGRFDGFIHDLEDMGQGHLVDRKPHPVSPTGTPYALDQFASPKLSEQLLKVGMRDLLTMGNLLN